MRTFKSMPGSEIGVLGKNVKFDSHGFFSTGNQDEANQLAEARYVEEIRVAKAPEDGSKEPEEKGKKGKA